MIHYVPFLKAKQGERAAMGELAPEVKSGICPLFDFPRNTPNYDEEGYGATTSRIVAGLKKHWGADSEFYFDDLDIGQTLSVEGEHQYAYVLKALYGLQVVPVVALDRINHNAAVARLKREDEIASDIVAFRAEQGDFEDFDDKEDQIDYDLANVFKEFKAIDLILDCRLCSGMDVLTTAQQIAAFSQKFCAAYPVRRVIVAGSSIPPSIRDVLGTHNVITLPRRELEIIACTSDLVDVDVVAGDYATVSPFYTDVEFDPKLLPKVTAPRLIYTFGHSYYIARGTSLASGGYEQYVGLTSGLCKQAFFRSGYSSGETYFYEKSKGIGGRAMNNTVVKPSVVAHITYMVLGAKL
jgi:hypothetical protein